jgi:hypothetical protein
MQALSDELIAFVLMLALAGGGAFAVYAMRSGFDYMGTRGNPRARAQAHESLVDLVKGALIIAGCAGGTALVVFGVFKPF